MNKRAGRVPRHVRNAQLRRDLELDRGLAHGPGAGDLPEIAIPEPEGTPHGQMLMAGNIAANFIEYPWRGADSVKDFALRLHEFLLGEEAFFEFQSPHDGEIHLLTRVGAMSILAINHARAKGPVAPHSERSKIVRVGAIPRELLQ